MPEPQPPASVDLTAALIASLAARGLTIAVAESLTGGQLTAELTRPAGASAVVNGGVVVYATQIKHTVVGVDDGLLAEHGPVHPEVARQLAERVRVVLAVDGRAADIGVSTTGVAGPDPQGGRPVGTVFVGVASGAATHVEVLQLSGDRAAIRAAAVVEAVAAVIRNTQE
ncbi:MAG: nicotinamide-nucleotide amidohydrolase family protein [Microbacteriaceae bacterium]|nr:nicotinamide-nucleotide amidohydrolase family protein [Microbacteriaceae bacterium]MCL2796296.1 nicotinamide-nucleotide amidohydrolase family protein [Microbacteriaceae bacterium]